MERQAEHEAALGAGAAAGGGGGEDAHAALPPSDLNELAKPKRQEVALRRCCPLMVGEGCKRKWKSKPNQILCQCS